MIAPETRAMFSLPSHRKVTEHVKIEVLRLVGGKVIDFQEEQFVAWFGKHWSRSGAILFADSTGVKTGKTKRGSLLNLAIKVTGREVGAKRARE